MINKKEIHDEKINYLKKQVKAFYLEHERKQNNSPLTLHYGHNDSYTIRTKSYKKGCHTLDCGSLDQIIEIDPVKRTALVEPRVTMESLVKATLPFGLTAPIIPEFKNITVGGAILGMAAESGSHQSGTFNETCSAFELILGDGLLIKATPSENSDIFYGIPGSYGSLGLLVSVEIQLVPAQDFVQLRYHTFNDPSKAIQALQNLSRASKPPNFLDGIIFSKDLSVIIEGNMTSEKNLTTHLSSFSQNSIFSEMYHQHVYKKSSGHPFEEMMTLHDYFFRYDLGAFWTGSYLFHGTFLLRFILQGLLKVSNASPEGFNEKEIKNFHNVPNPPAAWRACLSYWMPAKKLCRMLHQTEKWIQQRMVIQDFSIPEHNAKPFLEDILEKPGIFPIWLLPIKGTNRPQIFAPHLLSETEQKGLFINFGLYGIPSSYGPTENITRELEQKTHAYGGRKTLYSRSYYDLNEFWDIYSYKDYEALRNKTFAKGVWSEITDKVLSE